MSRRLVLALLAVAAIAGLDRRRARDQRLGPELPRRARLPRRSFTGPSVDLASCRGGRR